VESKAFSLASCLGYISTLKMKAISSSETFDDFQWAKRHYIPEVSTLNNPAVLPFMNVKLYVKHNSKGGGGGDDGTIYLLKMEAAEALTSKHCRKIQ
jgi:hypothetical protein